MIVIVGAGPAGLAMAAALGRLDLPYRVIERGRVGEAWHHHYERLHLHTLKQVSALPGYAMPTAYPRFPSRAQFLAYLQAYAQHHHLRIDEGVELRHAAYDTRGWRLDVLRGQELGGRRQASEGRGRFEPSTVNAVAEVIEASVLVMATGIWSAPVRAHIAGAETFEGPIMHSRDYRNAQPFIGQRVLVVGAGNSGTEIAVDLAEHGVETTITVRSGVAFVPEPHSAALMHAAAWLLRTLPRPLAGALLHRRNFRKLGLPLPPGSPLDHFPVVGYELPEAVAAGSVTVYPGLTRLQQRSAYFADGRSAMFDALILATGYRPALDPVAHELTFDAKGLPLLDHYGRACGNPHLVCVGYTYPTTEGWLQALGRVSSRAVAGIMALGREGKIYRTTIVANGSKGGAHSTKNARWFSPARITGSASICREVPRQWCGGAAGAVPIQHTARALCWPGLAILAPGAGRRYRSWRCTAITRRWGDWGCGSSTSTLLALAGWLRSIRAPHVFISKAMAHGCTASAAGAQSILSNCSGKIVSTRRLRSSTIAAAPNPTTSRRGFAPAARALSRSTAYAYRPTCAYRMAPRPVRPSSPFQKPGWRGSRSSGLYAPRHAVGSDCSTRGRCSPARQLRL
ncbi:NAD(P)/FAD-dependent oxidoreductase [Candidatus Gracilibacteria bacterium]|nr:NAD(P)/FAD-dependent oxidoreductase [Candidatus Gracilibacteria bacterium]